MAVDIQEHGAERLHDWCVWPGVISWASHQHVSCSLLHSFPTTCSL